MKAKYFKIIREQSQVYLVCNITNLFGEREIVSSPMDRGAEVLARNHLEAAHRLLKRHNVRTRLIEYNPGGGSLRVVPKAKQLKRFAKYYGN